MSLNQGKQEADLQVGISGAPRKAGEIWDIWHVRKGEFTFRILEVYPTGEWITGVIHEGSAGSAVRFNRSYAGDQLTLRNCFITWLRQVPTDQEGSENTDASPATTSGEASTNKEDRP